MKKLLFAFSVLTCSASFAQLPAGFTSVPVVTSLSEPTALPTDIDPNNFFICQKGGVLALRSNGVTTTVGTIAVSQQSERGLLGIALDPNYAGNGYIYLYYTTQAGSLNPPPSPKNRVSRFTISGNAIVPASEVILLDNIPSDAGNHNAGCLRFGQDGLLYISTGDGGSVSSNSQTLSNLAGKILRITSTGGIPATNPFVGMLSAREEIYCLGLRNPYRFSIRPGTNILYIGDVGSGGWEEVNVCTAGGQNFGWPIHEGKANDPPYIDPVYTYEHTQQESAVVTGGRFITGGNYPALYQGTYVFGDFLRGTITWLQMNGSDQLVQVADEGSGIGGPVDFAMGSDGNLYYADYFSGSVNRLVYTAATLSSLILTPTHVGGGNPVYGRVNLAQPAPAGGVTVNLSDNSGAIETPPSVFVPVGASTATFVMGTSVVTNQTNRVVTATSGVSTQNATLVLLPTGVKSLTLSPTAVQGGTSSTGTVTIYFAAPAGGATVALSDNSSAISVPSSMLIAQGSISGTFPINTAPVSATYVRLVSATYKSLTRSANLTLTP